MPSGNYKRTKQQYIKIVKSRRWYKGKNVRKKTRRLLSFLAKGRFMSAETRLKISKKMKGRVPKNAFKKGHRGYWKDKELSQSHKNNLSRSKKKHPSSTIWKKGQKAWNKGKRMLQFSGHKHWNWKGGITSFRVSIRQLLQYKNWVLQVYAKDDYTCQICNVRKIGKNIKLVAHHRISFNYILEKFKIKTIRQALKCSFLWNVNNGITICRICHNHFEKIRRKQSRALLRKGVNLEELKMYKDIAEFKFHIFTNNQDEYVKTKREAMKIYRAWIRDDIKDIRIYTVKFNAVEGIYDDIDCIYSVGGFPM